MLKLRIVVLFSYGFFTPVNNMPCLLERGRFIFPVREDGPLKLIYDKS